MEYINIKIVNHTSRKDSFKHIRNNIPPMYEFRRTIERRLIPDTLGDILVIEIERIMNGEQYLLF